jgi:hypothetical protein
MMADSPTDIRPAEHRRPIFRPEAVRRYARSEIMTVLPLYNNPPRLGWLYGVLLLLTIGGFSVLYARVDVSIAAQAIVLSSDGTQAGSQSRVLVLIPHEYAGVVRAGQSVILRLSAPSRSINGTISAVDADVADVLQARSQYALSPDTSIGPVFPATAVIIHPVPGELYAFGTRPVDGVYAVALDTQARRLISYLPLIDRLGGDVSR